jgi:hypothetical protein
MYEQIRAQLARQRDTQRLHDLGPRAVLELLEEIGCNHDIVDDVSKRLAGYARIDPRVLRHLGGDRFAPSVLRVMGGAA